MLERICSDVIFSNWCVCKHRVSGSLLPFPSPVLRNIPKYWQSCLFSWYTASFLLNVETVTHWFWRIPSSWKQKKILAPKRLVPSNFINYIWSLNTNRTSSYFLSTFLLFLNSTGFFAHWLGCCSDSGTRTRTPFSSGAFVRDALPVLKLWKSETRWAAAKCTHREHFYQCSWIFSLWKVLDEKEDLYCCICTWNADQAVCFFWIQQALPGGTPLLVMKQCQAQPVAPELLFMLLNSGAVSGLASLAPSQTWQEARRDTYGVCLTKRVTNLKYISINILFLVAISEKNRHCCVLCEEAE